MTHSELDLERYRALQGFGELQGWKIDKVLDDILLVEYIDTDDTGTKIQRNGLWIDINVTHYAWRLGKVHLVGPECKYIKVGDIIVFPNDKGIQASSINGLKHCVFLNEKRVFGVVSLAKDYKDSSNTKS